MEHTPETQPFSFVSESPVGILICHGFTSTPASMRPLANIFAREGWNVELPRLSGHGTRWQDMKRTRYTDWEKDLDHALSALKSRCSQIGMIGLSMGGALTLHTAARHPEIRSIVLINNAFLPVTPLEPFLPFLKHLIPSIRAIASDIKKPGEREIAYERTPSNGADEFSKLLRVVRGEIGQVRQPALIFKSKEDHALPVSNAEETFARIGSKEKELIWLENSYHVATQDNDFPFIAEKSTAFFRKTLGK